MIKTDRSLAIKERVDADPFGLRRVDFSVRVPEASEMFGNREAKTYINGCDYPTSVDDLLLVWELQRTIPDIRSGKVLDVMCGPGRLGRELLGIGLQDVTFHDGHPTMLRHAVQKAVRSLHPEQRINAIRSEVTTIPVDKNTFDLVVCHNSTHQLANPERLREAMGELVRIVKPGGHVVIADYQRDTSPRFLTKLEERLAFTRKKIRPLLVPTFKAAFTKQEWHTALLGIPNISWEITDAPKPKLEPWQEQRASLDHVKGHRMDYSEISLRIVIKKGEL